MKKINKICAIFVLMFVFSLSVFAADYAVPDDYKILADNFVIDAIDSQAYTGKAITPSVTVKYSDTTLTQGTDYTVTYTNNTKVGTATITVEGIGSFKGTKITTFKILNNISSASVSGVKTKTYTGSKQTQSLTVKFGKKTLKNGTDYTVSYSNNVNAGTATISITGKGSYAGTKKVTFKIERKSISKFSFSKVSNYTYTGKAIKPGVTVKNGKKALVKDTDYTLSYKSNTKVGTATVTVTGKGNYSGSKSITFKINKRSISSATVSGLKSKTYTGSAQTQSLTLTYNGITLKNKTDYTLSYKNNTKAGTATVTITGKGNFTGSVKKTFKINKRSVNDLKITAATSATYTGKAIKPGVTVKYGSKTLKKDTDYTVSYKSNTKVGTATITVTGKGNFTGSKKLTFKINQRSISSATVSGLKSKTYTGGKLTQSLTLKYNGITLKNGTDYTVSYSNNVKAGTATVTITGKGNFKSTKKLTFKISKRSITGLTFSKVKDQTYTGKAIKPGFTVKYGKTTLVKDTDYTVSYKSNTKVGTATMTVTGKGNYSGTKNITFKINKRSISSATVTGVTSKAYTGSSITQSLTLTYNGITLKNKTDYTVSYKSNKDIGTATVTITGKGNFTGTKKETFKIVPKTVSIKSAVVTDTSVKVTWDKVSNATGYELYMSKNGAEYTKAATITKDSTLNYTVKSLEDGTYSFKVRAYKTVSKTNYYGSYSSVKECTITTKSTVDYIVGKNIEVGTYKITPIDSTRIVEIEEYLPPEIYEGLQPGMGFAIYSLEMTNGYVTLTEEDAGITVKNGKLEKVDLSKIPVNIKDTVSDGMYLVGKDIAPGTYKVTAKTGIANVDVLGTLRPVWDSATLNEDYHMGYIEITEDHQAVNVLNGTLEKVDLTNYPVDIKTKVSNGTYFVGKDITPGIYKITTEAGVKEIYSNIRLANTEDEYWNWISVQNGYIEITEDIVKVNLLYTTLEKVNEIPENIQTTISDSGIYVVGKTIDTGIYKYELVSDRGEHESPEITKYSDLTMDYESETGYAYNAYGYIEITDSDYAVKIEALKLTKVDLDKIPENIKTKVSNGAYIVGKDIAPGTYKVTSLSESYYEQGYVEKYNKSYMSSLNWTGITGSLYGNGYIEITEDDYYIMVTQATLEKADINKLPVNIKDSVSEGMYIVGKDLEVGTYKVTYASSYGYIRLLTDLTGSDESCTYIWPDAGESFIEITDNIIAVQINIPDITIEKFDIDSLPVNIKNTVSDGTYIVGKDVAAGIYKIKSNNDYYCSVSIYSNLSMTEENCIYYVSEENGYVEIPEDAVCVSVNNGTITKLNKDDIETNIQNQVSDGVYLLGYEISAGWYKIVASGEEECWVTRYSSMNTSYENYIDDVGAKYGYVEIKDTDKCITVNGGTITKVDIDNMPKDIKETVTSGIYIVGKDVEPGIYKITCVGDCTYANVQTYTSMYMEDDSSSSYFGGANGYIEVKDTDKVLAISNGSKANKIDLDGPNKDIKTQVSDGTYIVGYDLEPGIYKINLNEDEYSCFINKYSSLDYDNSYENSFYNNSGYMEISETDFVIRISNGTMTKIDLNDSSKYIKEEVSDGEYIVGYDIEPGTYKITASEEWDCNVSLYSALNQNDETFINGVSYKTGYVEITSDAFVVNVSNGTIRKVDIDTTEKDIKTELTEGMYLVGYDLEPGVYRVESDNAVSIERYSSINTIWDNLIDDVYYQDGYVEIMESDVAVVVKYGTMTKIDLNNKPESFKTNLQPSCLYIVGYDIEPGIYKMDDETEVYVSKHSAINMNWDNLTSSAYYSYGYVEVKETDVAIYVSNGPITKVDTNIKPETFKTKVSDGMYLVGQDIEPGTYKMVAEQYDMGLDFEQLGEVRAFAGFDTSYGKETNRIDGLYGYIEIKDTDIIVEVEKATLEKVNLESMPVDIKTSVAEGVYIVGKDILPGTYKISGRTYGYACRIESIDIPSSATVYVPGQTIEVTEDDYAIYLWGAAMDLVEENQAASVSTMSLDEETNETENVEVVEEEKSNEEVSIYSEVNIYSEN